MEMGCGMLKKWLVIHHSAGPRTQTTAEISAFLRRPKHLGGRGFSWGAYAKLIEQDGSVHDDASETETRVAGAVGYNRSGIHVCVIGWFDPGHDRIGPDHPQFAALVQTCAVLCRRHKIPARNIIGHRDTFIRRFLRPGKSCPGQYLYALLPDLRQAVARYLIN